VCLLLPLPFLMCFMTPVCNGDVITLRPRPRPSHAYQGSMRPKRMSGEALRNSRAISPRPCRQWNGLEGRLDVRFGVMRGSAQIEHMESASHQEAAVGADTP